MTDVTKLIVSGFNWLTAGNNFIFTYLSLRPTMRIEFVCPLIFHFKNVSPNFFHWHRMFQNIHSFLLPSSDTLDIISLLLLLARYVNILYLLDPQLLASTPIKRDPLISLTGAWAICDIWPRCHGVTLTQVQWNVNERFCLCWNRKLFIICSSKRTSRISRIASLIKTEHVYNMQFTEEILSFTLLLLEPTVRIAGVQPQPYADKKQAPRQ
jgi:hypothetical protein